jgi:hypothetical protein
MQQPAKVAASPARTASARRKARAAAAMAPTKVHAAHKASKAAARVVVAARPSSGAPTMP